MDLEINWTQFLLWSSAISLAILLLTLVAVPWIVARLPSDYFASPHRHTLPKSARHPLLLAVFTMLKNVVGFLLLLLGLIMLVTPGQGLLTILTGVLLMNFPGKYELECYVVAKPGVLKALNWLRARGGHAPFEPPPNR
ncbi:MAG: PGPGW domain-containing protein [Pseudomonadota bacterium]